MKPKFAVIYSLGVLALGTCVTTAQENKGPGPGRLPGGSGGEGRPGPVRIAEVVKDADTNADGKLSKEEFLAYGKQETEKRFSLMDGNSDGVVDEAEIASVGERMREREGGMRKGGEGGNSEFRRPPGDSPEGGRRPEGARPEGGPRPEGEAGQRPGGGGQGAGLDEYFGRMDKNSDGSVDKEEFTAFSKQESERRFDGADENKDGKMSKEELRASLGRMRGMMRGGQGGPGRPGSGGGEGGVRRPPGDGERPQGDRPRPEGDRPRPEADAPKKDAA